MAMHITHLDGPLSAEVAGIVFHGQNQSNPQLIAFSKNFGELDPPGPNPCGEPFNKAHPELNVISNVVENGEPIGKLATARWCGGPT